MTFFTVFSMVLVSGLLLWIAALGFFGALFHNIGGNGKWYEVVIGFILCVVCIWGIVELWSRYSPFTVVAVGGAS
jgi:hypothetical protein